MSKQDMMIALLKKQFSEGRLKIPEVIDNMKECDLTTEQEDEVMDHVSKVIAIIPDYPRDESMHLYTYWSQRIGDFEIDLEDSVYSPHNID